MTDRRSTREALLDTAMRLFAARGVFQVSLAEVVRQGGQRNASAIWYHFGGRDQLLIAILEPRIRYIRERRETLLDRARATPAHDVRSAVEVMVLPVAELTSQGWRGRAFVQIGLDVADNRDKIAPEVAALLDETGSTEAFKLLRRRCPPMTDAVWTLRTNLCVGFVARATAERARTLDSRSGDGSVSDEAFVSNLIDMYIGAITAPLSYGGSAKRPSTPSGRPRPARQRRTLR